MAENFNLDKFVGAVGDTNATVDSPESFMPKKDFSKDMYFPCFNGVVHVEYSIKQGFKVHNFVYDFKVIKGLFINDARVDKHGNMLHEQAGQEWEYLITHIFTKTYGSVDNTLARHETCRKLDVIQKYLDEHPEDYDRSYVETLLGWKYLNLKKTRTEDYGPDLDGYDIFNS